MWPLISFVLVILGALGLKHLFPVIRNVRTRRRQVCFIRETLANGRTSNDRRVIASLSTVPDRIGNLGPTIRSLLTQTRPPDEIVLVIPEFSIREQRPYMVPKHVSRWPRMPVLECRRDWGPATKFILTVREQLAADRANTLIMVVDDDHIYPHDALETYFNTASDCRTRRFVFAGAEIPPSLDWRDARMIRASELSPAATRGSDHRAAEVT